MLPWGRETNAFSNERLCSFSNVTLWQQRGFPLMRQSGSPHDSQASRFSLMQARKGNMRHEKEGEEYVWYSKRKHKNNL